MGKTKNGKNRNKIINSNHREKRNRKKNRGMTLVELMVSFALISIFMVSATMLISSISNIYYQAKGVSYGLQVTNILQGKISEELAGALNEDITSDDFLDASGAGISGAMLISQDCIEFTNSDGSHVNLGLYEKEGKKYLSLHYYPVPTGSDGSNLYEAVDWTFDKETYMGYSVTDLKFSRPGGDYDYNIIQIDLTITSPKYGDYTTTEYVQCYNFDNTVSPSRIVDVN
jgi:prepilin-type N-terminal cleavage/methylation domain-containing protein